MIVVKAFPSFALVSPPTFSARNQSGESDLDRTLIPCLYNGPNLPDIPFVSPTILKSLHGKPNRKPSTVGNVFGSSKSNSLASPHITFK